MFVSLALRALVRPSSNRLYQFSFATRHWHGYCPHWDPNKRKKFTGFWGNKNPGNAHCVSNVQSQYFEWNNGVYIPKGLGFLCVKINGRCFHVEIANHFLKIYHQQNCLLDYLRLRVNRPNYFHVSFTWIVGGFGEIAIDVVNRFIAHDWEQSAFSVANFLQIVTRFWHSTDAGRSSTRCQVNQSWISFHQLNWWIAIDNLWIVFWRIGCNSLYKFSVI